MGRVGFLKILLGRLGRVPRHCFGRIVGRETLLFVICILAFSLSRLKKRLEFVMCGYLSRVSGVGCWCGGDGCLCGRKS
jgi:hypothetical protein